MQIHAKHIGSGPAHHDESARQGTPLLRRTLSKARATVPTHSSLYESVVTSISATPTAPSPIPGSHTINRESVDLLLSSFSVLVKKAPSGTPLQLHLHQPLSPPTSPNSFGSSTTTTATTSNYAHRNKAGSVVPIQNTGHAR
ncbi:hypothetical protein HK097_006926 [Rhizophlyctis rosea]|uniref:Uncharacterized protein n=1 Tax=Rhizophlyctis rosea TaxID=64517 RepID=A0AAD5SLY2_9FUNG|nr:hypothetical protein HK097_006926 [Rhizophlyctis rosea]